ncbi:phage integrase central domain-containing protein [Escherichia coli]
MNGIRQRSVAGQRDTPAGARVALDKDVFPVIGKQSVTDITPRGVLAILKKKERNLLNRQGKSPMDR